jgi:hypothetical protein
MSISLRLPVRYLAMDSRAPEENVEANIAPVEEVYEIDPRETALVLVDTWNKHPIRSHLERSGHIMQTRIAPLLPVVRAAGIPVIYAPSPDVAPRYPQWQRAFGARTPVEQSPAAPWPPPELADRTGRYADYRRRPGELPSDYTGPLPDDWWWDAIADCIAPEPTDDVVATGAELHEILSAPGSRPTSACCTATTASWRWALAATCQSSCATARPGSRRGRH